MDNDAPESEQPSTTKEYIEGFNEEYAGKFAECEAALALKAQNTQAGNISPAY